MLLGSVLTGLVGLGLLALLIYFPVRFFILIGQGKSLERRVKALTDRTLADPAQSAVPPFPAVAAVQGDVAAPVAPPVSPQPTDVPRRLRALSPRRKPIRPGRLHTPQKERNLALRFLR